MPTFVAEKNYPKSSQIWNVPECFAAKMTRSSSLSIWGFWFQNCAAPRGIKAIEAIAYMHGTHTSVDSPRKSPVTSRNKPTTVSKSLPSQSTLQWQWGANTIQLGAYPKSVAPPVWCKRSGLWQGQTWCSSATKAQESDRNQMRSIWDILEYVLNHMSGDAPRYWSVWGCTKYRITIRKSCKSMLVTM